MGEHGRQLLTVAGSEPKGRLVPAAFFARDTPTVARDLLGKLLVSRVDGVETGGRIVETEAYLGSHDAGSHASTVGITRRNAVMYGPPGRAYVYFTYGNHHMLNLITEPEGTAGGVLIRAIEPLFGIPEMMRRRAGGRRGEPRPQRIEDLARGPGRLAQALGVDLRHNASELGKGPLSVYDAPEPSEPVRESGRVGLSAGHELDLRFYLEGSPFVSRGRTGPKAPTKRAGMGRTVRGRA